MQKISHLYNSLREEKILKLWMISYCIQKLLQGKTYAETKIFISKFTKKLIHKFLVIY